MGDAPRHSCAPHRAHQIERGASRTALPRWSDTRTQIHECVWVKNSSRSRHPVQPVYRRSWRRFLPR
ncbi:DUF1534 domain-containing protein [Pseudomonas syringae pv. maculicola str. ES4326]|uniref:DUF1534 domain-containing protein n=1 Tax=Pseudomonas syringae pv. maculicola str. ES4326 TaxID=629265 RepID=A0A8T8C2E5_PSEYM|nr:DUF1534 domain-containing protein [Pseudomonas syringae pv. maculicola str. ES4326]